jgi:hypothetical protein
MDYSMNTERFSLTFNSPLESGIRALATLVPSFPNTYDLQRLLAYDYLIIHSGDVGGPDSLHPHSPLRPAELLVRRQLVTRGVYLMMSRGLITRTLNSEGMYYGAGEESAVFLSTLSSPYISALRERGEWLSKSFGDLPDDTLFGAMSNIFGKWVLEFQAAHQAIEDSLI